MLAMIMKKQELSKPLKFVMN
jgi:nucleotidyltransferase substrate binding protein (TIGR01987 family)